MVTADGLPKAVMVRKKWNFYLYFSTIIKKNCKCKKKKKDFYLTFREIVLSILIRFNNFKYICMLIWKESKFEIEINFLQCENLSKITQYFIIEALTNK
jgi:hypothetical protein